MNDLSGTRLGQYHLIALIGKGGMATVYRAHQSSMGRDVAIKIMSPDLADEPEFMTRFEREAQIIAQLQHPNILPVYDFGREGRLTYFVMRLVSGGNLGDELRGGPLPVERVVKLTYQIASALDYAHLRGIVHRDLKPTNILLDDEGNAYLTDFGIAKLLSGGTVTGLTAKDAVMGTPTYMAPEQWRSEPVDGRTDVYALGVIVYQMLLGQVPFASETPHGLMYQHLDQQPPSPHALDPNLPLSIEPVVRKALAKHREHRYASATELATALDRALHSPARMPEQTGFEQPPLDVTMPGGRSSRPRPDRQDGSEQRTQPGAPPPAAPPVGSRSGPPPYPPAYAAPQPVAPQPVAPPPALSSVRQPRSQEAMISAGYVPPYEPPRSNAGYHPPAYDGERGGGIGRLMWALGIVSAAVILLFGVIFVVALIFGTQDKTPTQPTAPPGTVAPTAVPAEQRPTLTITSPASTTNASLGVPVVVQYVAESANGITRVELRRFSRVIDSVQVGGSISYQGTFTYTPDSTGVHILDVVPWSGNIPGDPATVTIIVRN